jgi:SnoaL-like polyketide cyclase
MMRAGFSDIQWELKNMVAEGDTVAAQFVMRGTHDGTFFGVPATGRKIEARAMNFYRFKDGKIVAEVGLPDLRGLMKQMALFQACDCRSLYHLVVRYARAGGLIGIRSYRSTVGRVGCSFQFGRTSILSRRPPHLPQTTLFRKYGTSVSAG